MLQVLVLENAVSSKQPEYIILYKYFQLLIGCFPPCFDYQKTESQSVESMHFYVTTSPLALMCTHYSPISLRPGCTVHFSKLPCKYFSKILLTDVTY
jgi:hypothetical protein